MLTLIVHIIFHNLNLHSYPSIYYFYNKNFQIYDNNNVLCTIETWLYYLLHMYSTVHWRA